ncbi:hypothetical protein [Agaribacter flavus]|uniref:Pili assembly chaperone N-terminal domain-containing protein n=1 Tax=Agaribacter flavus TaxID=1902781 RepID=A0ABV7FM82_9ALTE
MRFTILMLSVITFFTTYKAHADLLITPTLIKFEERDRVKEVILLNTSSSTRKYTVEWLQQEQKPGGQYHVMSESQLEEFSTASEYLRVSPRRVTLAPGENQRVKLLLRRSADMKKQEYRSHLKFTALPTETEEEESVTSGVAIRLKSLISYSIPVVLNFDGKKDADLKIEQVNFLPSTGNSRHGNIYVSFQKPLGNSVFGDLVAKFKKDGSSEFVPVGFLNGVNIFHENEQAERLISWSQNVPVEPGTLSVEFNSLGNGGRFVVAEKRIALN